ncbi:MAG: EAL domain-containing protein [Bryobacteraceae bacterium]
MHPRVVAIGSSAGGLEALKAVVGHLPSPAPFAYILAQHLSPHHTSMLRVLLARDSALPVSEAADGVAIAAGNIYVTPPNSNVLVTDGHIVLRTASEQGSKPSVDLLFQSLARECGPSAIAVILSGSGTDGSRGVRAVKSAGGHVIVQTPPSAKFTGMPQAAVDSGCADVILQPEEIGPHLARLASTEPEHSPVPSPEESVNQRVFAETGIDLAAYKPKTVRRRLRQRMSITGAGTIAEYAALLEQKPEEIGRLARTCLVSVTSFFRDSEAFSRLGEILVQSSPPGFRLPVLRVWVPGCSGGQEAFSLAILLDTVLPERKVQVFATEPSDEDIAKARRALFSAEEVASVPPDLLEKYFRPSASGYQVDKRIRDRVVFAKHNLLRDPIFLNLDLISCRNLLIYFKPEVQQDALRKFHMALRKGGVLFLGKSEHANLQGFEAADRSNRIYVNMEPTEGERRNALVRGWMPPEPPARTETPKAEISALGQTLLDHCTPAAVLVDANLRVIETSGDVSRYLTLKPGRADLSLPAMAPKEIASGLRAQIFRCQRLGVPTRGIERAVSGPNGPFSLRTEVIPAAGRTPAGEAFVVTFQEPPAAAARRKPSAQADDHTVADLERQLSTAHESLHSMVEQLETANEELQTLNQELQSANEEMQASNEELQASNEEIQSTNEELVTVNDELESKSSELVRLLEDFQEIQDSIDSPILVLDGDGNIRYLNREATARLGITPAMIGARLTIPSQPRLTSSLKARVARVRDGSPSDMLTGIGDRRYHIRLRPQRGQKSTGPYGQVIHFQDVTELHRMVGRNRRAETRLRELVSSHKAVFDSIPAHVAVLDARGVIVAVNQAWIRFGAAEGLPGAESCVGLDYLRVCDAATGPDAQGAHEVAAGIRAVLAGATDLFTHDYPCHAPNERRWFQCQVAQYTHAGVRGAVVTHINVTPEMKLREELARQAAALHSSVNAILILDTQGRIDWANESLARMSGFEIPDLIGKTPDVLEASASSGSLQRMTEACRKDGRAQDGEARMRSKGGEEYTVRQSATPILDAAGKISHIVVVQEDITQHKRTQQQMVYLAEHDDLTGLKNRKSFLECLHEAIGRHARTGGRMAVLFLDLDRFKDTNDTLGHMIGDRILVEIAARLRSCLRESDTLARFGGDEFVVLVEQLAEKERVMLVVERILNSFNRPLEIEGRTIFLTSSVGVTVFPDDGATAEILLRNADMAMYRAKAEGRRGYRLYDQKLESEISQRFNIERELNRALGTSDIWLAYQPQIDLRSGAVIGAECLFRWNGCAAHDIAVGRVISIAEESGAILPIGQWVLREAIQQLRRWQDKGISLRMSVNLSAVQFHQQDVFGIVTDCLGTHGLPPKALKAEITESALLHRSVRVREMLHALHGAGIGLILDDFGTGYSSLSYLQSFPIEAVKIDSSFLSGVGRNKNDEAIVRGIIQMAHSLGQSVIAEGVETEEQLDFLRQCQCDYAQGFLLARPLPPAEFEAFLGERAQAASA